MKIKQKKQEEKQMVKFLINIAQLYLILWVTIKIAKVMLFKSSRQKSIVGKSWYLVSKKIHRKLDRKIVHEKSLALIQQSPSVVQFKKRKAQ